MPLPRLNIFEKLRGIYHPVTEIRRRILIEVARMVAEGKKPEHIEAIPYLIIDRNTPTYRDCIFKERAIVRERVRLAFGMDVMEFGAAHAPIIDDVKPALVDHKFIKKPIVNVIKIGCERCPTESYFVTDNCKMCIAHPCVQVCPKKAVSLSQGRAHIDQELCISCGRCEQVCPYNAIVYRERPCAAACGVNAITTDEEGFAEIDYDKCVTCGLCIVSCPFGAIAEKSEIAQVILALKNGPVYAAMAPSFVGQFGPLVKPSVMPVALERMGFAGLVEVAYGADIAVMEESVEVAAILKERDADSRGGKNRENPGIDADGEESGEGKRKFVGTSCCPSWVKAARNNFPELAENISESYTPMVEAAKKVKEQDPDAKVVFIGPCIAKKMECFDPRVSKHVDFVITFEELAALFQAMKIDPTKMEGGAGMDDVSVTGRAFPVAGGVASAIIDNMGEEGRSIPWISAETLEGCIKMLRDVGSKKMDPAPLLVEGMACPNGCIGGPGTLAPLKRARRDVKKFADEAKHRRPSEYL